MKEGPTRVTSRTDHALALVLLVWLWSAVLHVLASPWQELFWLGPLIVAVRFALLAAVALLVRPWPWKLVLLSVLIWGGLDLLATSGLFSVYDLLRPESSFPYFQF